MFVTYTRCGNVAMFTIYQHMKFQMTGSYSYLVIIINPMLNADLTQPVSHCFKFKKKKQLHISADLLAYQNPAISGPVSL